MSKKVLFVFGLLIATFLLIAKEVTTRGPIYFDESALLWIRAHSSGFYDHVLLFCTMLGNAAFIAPITAVIVGTLWYKKQRFNALLVLASVVGTTCINVVLKLIFQRERPDFWTSPIHELGYSFPSGHAMISCALMTSLVLVFWNTRARWWVVAGGVIVTAAISYSRLYLGVHYPTDIIAGWMVSLVWVLGVFLIGRWLVGRRRHKPTSF